MAKSYIRLERYALFDRFRNLEERDVGSLDWIRSSTIQISRDPWHDCSSCSRREDEKLERIKLASVLIEIFFFLSKEGNFNKNLLSSNCNANLRHLPVVNEKLRENGI